MNIGKHLDLTLPGSEVISPKVLELSLVADLGDLAVLDLTLGVGSVIQHFFPLLCYLCADEIQGAASTFSQPSVLFFLYQPLFLHPTHHHKDQNMVLSETKSFDLQNMAYQIQLTTNSYSGRTGNSIRRRNLIHALGKHLKISFVKFEPSPN